MDASPTIRFDDGAAYESFMGVWSRSVGEAFLEWLAPPPALRWLDVGCGNGAFTALIAERCAPATLHGVDPSEAQVAWARSRLGARGARFDCAGAMALPSADAAFDAAVMALVLFFVPEPARGVAEMVRVVAAGGSVSAYAWDFAGGGFPYAVIQEELAALGAPPLLPPSVAASRLEAMRDLWTGAGLAAVETRQISVQRTFDDFEDFWAIAQAGPPIAPGFATLAPREVEVLKARVRARLPASADGSVTFSAHANAVKGTVRG